MIQKTKTEKKSHTEKKSNIVFFIDKNGNKQWKWRNNRGAIYSK